MGRADRSAMLLLVGAGGGRTETGWVPAADLYRTPEGWIVKVDLAGVRPADLVVSTHGRELVIRGARRDLLVQQRCAQYRMEIAYSAFERSIAFPCELDRHRLVTEYRDGMLLVFLHAEP